MSHPARDSIYQAIASIRLIDPHTHINPHAPASRTLADLLGYHYYTELAHSSGMPKKQIEEPGIQPRELVRRLVHNLSPIENTSQYRWLVEICRKFFGFEHDRIDTSNWEALYEAAEEKMIQAEWSQMVLDQSNVEAVFLTNDFDDPLAGFDTNTYIPCLRTDDLVFKLHHRDVRERLERCSGVSLSGSLSSLRDALRQRFEHFTSRGARACAISLPPSFEPSMVNEGRASHALGAVLRHSESTDSAHLNALSKSVFWMLAELCDEFGLPFDLMIGVNRGVYAAGVYQGQDLYDSRVSLIQYRELFNTFPGVKFPVSVLASVTNQELVSYAWIFPNVVTNGHWWYSNTPSFIHRDAAVRLEAVPQTKQIAYYSDAYKLEFVWPKFDMYRNILANILAEHFVGFNGWSEEQAIELGRKVLRGNVEEIFPSRISRDSAKGSLSHEDIANDENWSRAAAAASSAALTAGSIGVVEVLDSPAIGDERPVNIHHQDWSDGADESVEIVEEVDEFVDLDEESDTAHSDGIGMISHDVFDLDPLPNEDELKSLDIDDVVLIDHSTERKSVDVDAIDRDADSEPLDVGDLTSLPKADSIDSKESPINMLRGEESFTPDEDSLQLRPDPLTGELTFPVPKSLGEENELLDQLGIGFVDDNPEEQVRFKSKGDVE